MKYCPNCQTTVNNESWQMCPNCGSPLKQIQNCQQQGYQQQGYQQQGYQQQGYQQQNYQQNYNCQPNTQPYGTNPYYSVASRQQLPMNWYKALIYAVLFIGMILNLSSAITTFTGYIYVLAVRLQGSIPPGWTNRDIIDYIYSIYGSTLKICDVFYAICLFISVIYTIFVRQYLAKFKKSAPTMLIGLYVFNIATSIIYTIWQSIIISNVTGELPSDIMSNVRSIVISAAMIIANYNYFKNRKHLFVK